MQPIRSNIFKMSRGAMLRELTLRYGKLWLIAGCLAFVVLCMASVILGDVRWGIVGLMVICIILPMGMAMLYFNHALNPDITFNILNHDIETDGEEVRINYYTKEKLEEVEVEEEGKKERWKRIGGKKIPTERMGKYVVGIDSVMINIADEFGKKTGWIWIPGSAFEKKELLEEFIKKIYEQQR